MLGLGIASILSAAYAFDINPGQPPYDAQDGIESGPEYGAYGNENLLFALSDEELFTILRHPAISYYSLDGGKNWETLKNPFGETIAASWNVYQHGSDTLWIPAGNQFYKLQSGAKLGKLNMFNYPFDMADQFGTIESVELHPSRKDSAVFCGQHECLVGVFAPSNTKIQSLLDAKQCVMDPYAISSAWCAMKDSYTTPGLLVYLDVNDNSGFVATPVPVEADGKQLESVSQLFTNAQWTIAVMEDQLAVKGASKWAFAKHEGFDRIFFHNGVANGIIAEVERGGHGYIWTMSSDGLSFKETRKGKSPLIIVASAIYTDNTISPFEVSYNNGNSWEQVTSDISDIDFSTLLTSKRMNVALTDRQDRILYSYDGVEWASSRLPFTLDGGYVSLMLVDHGSAVVVWKRGTNEVYLSQDSNLSTWLTLEIPLANVHDDYDWISTPNKPTLIFNSRKETVIVDLISFMGDGRSCSASDVVKIDQKQCVLGSKVSLMVRKPGVRCLMGPLVENQFSVQQCGCTIEDYGCGAQYHSVNSQCIPNTELRNSLSKCEAGSKQIVPLPQIPILGTQCKGGVKFSANAFYECQSDSILYSDELEQADATGIITNIQEIKGKINDYLYIPGSESARDDETVLMWNRDGELYISNDQGSSWAQPSEIKNVLNVYKSDTDDNQIYVFTETSMDDWIVWVSYDRALTFQQVKLPAKPSLVFSLLPNLLSFHPNYPEWMLYTGMQDCGSFFCPGITFVSKDKGNTWNLVYEGSTFCQWVSGLMLPTNDDLVYCFEMNDIDFKKLIGNKGLRLKFTWSTDYYESGRQSVEGLETVSNLAVDGKYIIASYTNEFGEADIAISRDGINFEPANYPKNVELSKEDSATVVTTENNSIKLFQTISSKLSSDFGVLMKSDERGTNFVTSLEYVNRDSNGFLSGFIDYDSLQSVKGVAMANIVVNPDDVLNRGVEKKINTVITHSDGAHWAPLVGPSGNSLHLHGYTERLDFRNKPSSPTAVGIFMGRGNEGDSLLDLRGSQTYMSRDAGVSWKKVSDRPMFWEFGDSGSVVVLIDSMEPTNKISFSLDEGETWQEYQFWETPIKVVNLATIPSDTSRKFIVFGTPPVAYGDKSVAIQVDFSNLISRPCKDGDFDWWTPEHPQLGTKCLLGQQIEYRRKKTDRQCIVGKNFDDARKQPTKKSRIVKTCKCTREDYECDVNYMLSGNDGRCLLAPQTPEPSMEEQCSRGAIAWHKVTGYRKVATSKCEGGEQLDTPEEYACPGKEDEFDRQHNGNDDEDDDDDDDNDNDNDSSSPSDGVDTNSPGFFRRIWNALHFVLYVIFGILFCVALVYIGYTVFRRVAPSVSLGGGGEYSSVQFSNSEYPQQALDRSFDAARSIISHVAGLWRFVRTNIPYFGSQVPQERLGFYSRMSNDERYRLLEEEGFEDDSDDEVTVGDVIVDGDDDADDADTAAPFTDDTSGEHLNSPFADEPVQTSSNSRNEDHQDSPDSGSNDLL